MKEVKYEVDLRDRKTGNSTECILSTTNHDEAWMLAEQWNKTNVNGFSMDIPYETYIDGTDGLIADVYETSYIVE